MQAVVRFSLFVAAMSLVATPATAAASKWKLFRTYVQVQSTEPVRAHFRIWFHDIEPAITSVGVGVGEDPATLPKERFPGAVGVFGVKPTTIAPVPAEQKAIADALVKRVKELHPNATEFAVAYEGTYRLIGINEFTPTYAAVAQERLGVMTLGMGLRVDGKTGKISLGAAGVVGFGRGFGAFCGNVADRNCNDEKVRLVDYTLPPPLEGSSVLAGSFHTAPAVKKLYAGEWAKLSALIVKTADAIDAGTYRDPRNAVFARQGSDVLPPKWNPYYDVALDGRGVGPQGLYERESARVSMIGAWEQAYTVKAKLPKLGLTVEGTVHLGDKVAEFSVADAKGNRAAKTFAISYEEKDVVKDGKRFALPTWISLQGEGPKYRENDVCLPGEPYKTPCVNVERMLLAMVFAP